MFKYKAEKMFKMVSQQELWRLHYAGEVRTFNQYGTISKQYTLTKGNIK